MKSIIFKFWILAFLFMMGSCKDSVESNEGGGNSLVTDVKGKVQCTGQGIAGVVVTDGTNFAVTDEDGGYSLPYNSQATHVYISSPSGYSVAVENSVPQFYVKLNSISDKSAVNFNLIKLNDSDLKHYFIAIGDPQVRNEDELVKLKPILDFLKTDLESNHLNPVHLMIPGDIVFDAPVMHTSSKNYYKAVNQPVYYCIGNHDHIQNTTQAASDSYDKTAANTYMSHYGPNVLFI